MKPITSNLLFNPSISPLSIFSIVYHYYLFIYIYLLKANYLSLSILLFFCSCPILSIIHILTHLCLVPHYYCIYQIRSSPSEEKHNHTNLSSRHLYLLLFIIILYKYYIYIIFYQ